MVDALLQQTNLWDVRKKALSTFSGGMKQRFGIAQALLGNPRLIIVDEPTAGLDPAERNRFLNLLSSLGSDRTVILSTHIVDDVRQLCPRMAIIASGELLLEGAPNDTLAALNGKIWSKVVPTDEELRAHRNSAPRHLHAPGRRTARSSRVCRHFSGRWFPLRRFRTGRRLLPQPVAAGQASASELNLAIHGGIRHGTLLGVLHFRAQIPFQEYLHLRLFLPLARFLFLCVASESFGPVGSCNGKVLLNWAVRQHAQRHVRRALRHHRHRSHLRHVHSPRLPARHLPDPLYQADFQVRLPRADAGPAPSSPPSSHSPA